MTINVPAGSFDFLNIRYTKCSCDPKLYLGEFSNTHFPKQRKPPLIQIWTSKFKHSNNKQIASSYPNNVPPVNYLDFVLETGNVYPSPSSYGQPYHIFSPYIWLQHFFISYSDIIPYHICMVYYECIFLSNCSFVTLERRL